MLEELSKTERYSHADPETVASVLEEQGRFMQEVFAPTNAIGDREGLVWSPEGVEPSRRPSSPPTPSSSTPAGRA